MFSARALSLWDEVCDGCVNRPSEVDRDKLRRLLCGAVDQQVRPQVWEAVSGAALRRRHSEGLYAMLLQKTVNQRPINADDIDRDLPRAFPSDPSFNTPENLQRLREVLYALCMWHPSVYYCQSLCFLAGFLLMTCDNEATFFILQQFHTLQMRDYFTQPMLGWQVDQHCLGDWLANHPQLSKVVAHMASLRCTVPMLISQWVLCAFINTLPLEQLLPLWDVSGIRIMPIKVVSHCYVLHEALTKIFVATP